MSFPSPGELPARGSELSAPASAGGFFITTPLGKPIIDVQPWISLMYTAWRFDSHILRNDDHSKFTDHPSSGIKIKEINFFSCDENC